MTDVKPKRKRTNYSDEIWFCIRTVYEADGKSSIERITEIVSEFTGITELPNRRTIGERADKEGWERPQNIRQKTNAQLEKIMAKAQKTLDMATEEDIKNTINQDDKENIDDFDEYVSQRDKIVSQALNGVKKLLSTSARRKLKIADVIRRDRNMVDQVQNLTLHVMDQLIINKTLMQSREFKKLANGADQAEDLEAVEHAYGMALGLVEPVMFLTNAIEKQAKLDAVLYGITSEDTREPETAGRMEDLEDDKAYEVAIAQLNQRNIEMAQRRIKFENGEFEREIMQQVEDQMNEQGFTDDDISEIEDDEYED